MTDKRLQLIGRAKQSLISLGQIIMPRQMNVPSPEFHYVLSDFLLDKTIKFQNIIAPRGIAKTTLVGVLGTIHHLFLDKDLANMKKVVVLISRTQTHAINVLQTIKNLFEYSQGFRALFGYWGQHRSTKWTNDMIDFKEFAIVCRGAGQMVRGINIDGQRPTKIILDDPEDENNTKTGEAMKATFNWFMGSVVPSIDAQRGSIQVIGTPLAENCLVFSLKEMENWETKHYSYLLNKDGDPVFEVEAGNWDQLESIWPDMKSVPMLKEEHDALSTRGRASLFYQERLCWVTGDEDQLIKKEYIKYWDGDYIFENGAGYIDVKKVEGVELEKPKRVAINAFMGVDPASSLLQSADFSVICVVGVDDELNRYVIEMFRKRVSPMHLGQKILDLYHKYKPVRTKIENTGFQEMLREYVSSKGYIPGIAHKTTDTSPRTSKSRRLEALQPMFAEGKVYIKEDMTDFENELLLFPRARHDDTLDGFYYASLKNYPATHSANPTKLTKGANKLAKIDWKTV